MTKENWARKTAVNRDAWHHYAGNHRPPFGKRLSSYEYNVLAALGEAEFAERFDLPLPRDDLVYGDGGTDFQMQLRDDRGEVHLVDVDVKTASKPVPCLIVEWWKTKARTIYVLAIAIDGQGVRLRGWAWGKTLMQHPKKQFSENGPINHWIFVRDLRSIKELERRHVGKPGGHLPLSFS